MEAKDGQSSVSNGSYTSIQDRTQWCIDTINNPSSAEPKKVLLLLGRPGVGKSSFLENVTDASGHAGDGTDPVTKKFQIETVTVDESLLFVMDTPGINTNAEAASLEEIARGINCIRSKAQIVGVFYVSKITDRNEAIDETLRTFVQNFCGSSFMPQVTFITTYWTAEVEKQRIGLNRNLEELKKRHEKIFVEKGAKFYEHGREFVNGDGPSEFLHWWRDQSEIAHHAKSMILSWYGGTNKAEVPRFVKELESGVPVLQTDAARALGVYLTTETFMGQVWDFFTSLRPKLDFNERGFSISVSTPHQEDNIRGTFQHSPPRIYARNNLGSSSRQPRIWPARFDRSSVADNMDARGLGRTVESRKQMANSWGVHFPGQPGDSDWNTAYLRELNKRDPW